jgi:hypothetical protein
MTCASRVDGAGLPDARKACARDRSQTFTDAKKRGFLAQGADAAAGFPLARRLLW